MKMVIAGASGFLGSHLVRHFEGNEIISLTRSPKSKEDSYWNPELGKIDLGELEDSEVVINLAGENIFGRWTPQKLKKIESSRLIPTKLLTESLLKLKNPPKLFVNASAVGYYGDRGEELLTDESDVGKGQLADICKKWEEIPLKLLKISMRVVLCRFGIILGKEGGVLKKIRIPFKLGLGGKLGSGTQYMSWIAIDDVSSAMEYVISHKEIAGPVNFTAPQAVTNAEFTQAVSEKLKTPAFMNIPEPVLSLLFGLGKEPFVMSTKAYPKKLLTSGYIFKLPNLEAALKKYM